MAIDELVNEDIELAVGILNVLGAGLDIFFVGHIHLESVYV